MATLLYQPRPVAALVDAEIQILVLKLLDGRVTFLLGAGVSRALPTDLPLAPELAEWLVQRFASQLPSGTFDGVKTDDLLAVADAIEAAHQQGLQLMQISLRDVPFASRPPNYSHLRKDGDKWKVADGERYANN